MLIALQNYPFILLLLMDLIIGTEVEEFPGGGAAFSLFSDSLGGSESRWLGFGGWME